MTDRPHVDRTKENKTVRYAIVRMALHDRLPPNKRVESRYEGDPHTKDRPPGEIRPKRRR